MAFGAFGGVASEAMHGFPYSGGGKEGLANLLGYSTQVNIAETEPAGDTVGVAWSDGGAEHAKADTVALPKIEAAVGECTQMLDIVQHVLMRIQDELEANPRMRLDSGLCGSLLAVCERLRCFRNGAEGHSVLEVAFPAAEGRRVPTALLTPASVASVDTAVRASDQNGELVIYMGVDFAAHCAQHEPETSTQPEPAKVQRDL